MLGYSLLSFLLSLSLWCFLTHGDNPTSIVKPYSGPDPGYILAESDGGLANRLRVLAAYMYIGEYKYEGAHLAFIWDLNSACPGHFLEIFQPIKSVIFATNSSRYVLDKHAKLVYENSWAVFPWIMQMNDIPKQRYGLPTWSQIEYSMYSRYIPTPRVMDRVLNYVVQHEICQCSAMHIRLTDLSTHLARTKKAINVQAYYDFVDSRPQEEAIYLLTDNPVTQKAFLDKYGPKKILVYSQIASQQSSYDPLGVVKTGGKYNNASLSSSSGGSLPEDHRYTSLEHTLIDVLIASHAQTFKGSMYSSLTDLVNMFRQIGKKDRGWCNQRG